jgi:hypothetical protein
MGLAQGDKPAEPSGYYRLDFVVKELEGGKTVNSRAYSTTISTEHGGRTSIRTGSRVPVAARDGSTTYMDVGLSFDCAMAKVVGSEFAVNISADISSMAEPASTPPVIRNNRWSGDVIVPLRKGTVVFSSDDAMSKRQMQLELTATPVK